jgi:hypothetical protein
MARSKGQKPGALGYDIRGLQAKWSDSVEQVEDYGRGKLTGNKITPGWFVFVQVKRGTGMYWEAIISLRFERQIDAQRAVDALTWAELDSAKRMKAAGGETVIRTAFEALQW